MARILVNHFSPIPNKFTGISVYTWKILEALAKHGRHEYMLATNWDIASLPAHIRALEIEKIQRPLERREIPATLRNTLHYASLKKKLGCDAIFHPQPASLLTGLRKSVIVIHDLYRVTHPHLFTLKQRLQWKYLTARAFRRAGRLIAVSEATRRAVIKAYPDTQGRIEVVHEASPLNPGETKLPHAPVDEPYGLVVANITPSKNIGLLIEALKQLATKGIRPRITLVGRDENGILPGLLADRRDLALTCISGMSDEELSAYYAHARVYINTSLMEGFCLPLLEAHSFGVPVICSDLPVLREVAGDGAIFVDPRNPAALASAIEMLFNDEPLAGELRLRAKNNVKRFSWQRAAQQTEAVLDRVIAA